MYSYTKIQDNIYPMNLPTLPQLSIPVYRTKLATET
jgi:hypothetical protein